MRSLPVLDCWLSFAMVLSVPLWRVGSSIRCSAVRRSAWDARSHTALTIRPRKWRTRRLRVGIGMTALTVPEIQRLLIATSLQRIPTNQDIEFHLAWSN